MNGFPPCSRCWCRVLLALLALTAVVGCGTGGPAMGTVVGAVTVDDQPAPEGAISFVPLDGMSPTAGTKIVDGRYRAEVPVGSFRVEIRIPKVVGQRKAYNTPDSPMVSISKEILPAHYNDDSKLELDVQSGTNKHDFELFTKQVPER